MLSHKHLILLAAALACTCLISACSSPSGESDHATSTIEDTVAETPADTTAESVIPTEPEETTATPESDVTTEAPTESETEAETEPDPLAPTITYHSMPLTGKNDTTSRLSIMDYPEEAEQADRIVFQILPTDTSDGKHADAHTLFIDGESHILVLAYAHKETGNYSIVVLQERSYTRETANGEKLRVVDANCYRLGCSSTLIPITQEQSVYATAYDGAGHTFSYTEQTKFSQLAVNAFMMKNIQSTGEHLLSGLNAEEYELTVLYSLSDGETQVSVPVTEVPTFSWSILDKYASM